MPRNVKERMVTYNIAMTPTMITRVKKCAAEDDISARLWVREAIETYLDYQERQREAKQREAKQREQVSA